MADSLYRRIFLAVTMLAISVCLAAILELTGVLQAVGPIVSAPVPGPCGCGGGCCQVDQPEWSTVK